MKSRLKILCLCLLCCLPLRGQDRRSDLRDEVATLDELEADHIRRTIDRCHGNLSKAAELLGITRQTLYNKMKRLE